MYDSIVITNNLVKAGKRITYKFTLVFDKTNWQTIATLKVFNREYIANLDGEYFLRIKNNIMPVFNLPYDPEGKVYDGEELKIRFNDAYGSRSWSNTTNLKAEFDKAFNIPGLYVDANQQKYYNHVTKYLINIGDAIFEKQLENTYSNI